MYTCVHTHTVGRGEGNAARDRDNSLRLILNALIQGLPEEPWQSLPGFPSVKVLGAKHM